MATEENGPTPEGRFDFAAHRRKAIDAYSGDVREQYHDCAQAARSVLTAVLKVEDIDVQLVEARAKGVESFGDKAAEPHEVDANRPKYPDPLGDITDLAGVRVIVYLEDRRDEVDALIYRQFDVVRKRDVSGRFVGGYDSIHYLVKFKPPRVELPEYERFAGLVVEIQVRTVLQHAWSEVEHGIVYKPKGQRQVSDDILQRLGEVAAMLRQSDRELQRIDTTTKQGPRREDAPEV